jgi:CII-binding regulator of phage lambda lysogenization HflD
LKSAASFVGLHYMQLHINAANQDLAKSNNAGVALKLKQANKALKNDSSLLDGLGQRISQIARNNSAPMHSHSREQLSALGTALKILLLPLKACGQTLQQYCWSK